MVTDSSKVRKGLKNLQIFFRAISWWDFSAGHALAPGAEKCKIRRTTLAGRKGI
jgi:hypothetical protein